MSDAMKALKEMPIYTASNMIVYSWWKEHFDAAKLAIRRSVAIERDDTELKLKSEILEHAIKNNAWILGYFPPRVDETGEYTVPDSRRYYLDVFTKNGLQHKVFYGEDVDSVLKQAKNDLVLK